MRAYAWVKRIVVWSGVPGSRCSGTGSQTGSFTIGNGALSWSPCDFHGHRFADERLRPPEPRLVPPRHLLRLPCVSSRGGSAPRPSTAGGAAASSSNIDLSQHGGRSWRVQSAGEGALLSISPSV